MAGKLVGFRIPEPLGETLRVLAKREGIQESKYAARILIRHLRRMEKKKRVALDTALAYLRATPHQPAGRSEEQKARALAILDARDYPVWTAIWDNPVDAIYDSEPVDA